MSTLTLSLLSLHLSGADAAAALDAIISLHTAQSHSLQPLPEGTLEETASLAARYAVALTAARNDAALYATVRTCYGERSTNRQKAERRNVAALVDALLAAGYTLNVFNGGDEAELPAYTADRAAVLGALFACDMEAIACRRMEDGKMKQREVQLVYGNADDGSEVVCDYSESLSPIIEPLSDSWQPA